MGEQRILAQINLSLWFFNSGGGFNFAETRAIAVCENCWNDCIGRRETFTMGCGGRFSAGFVVY